MKSISKYFIAAIISIIMLFPTTVAFAEKDISIADGHDVVKVSGDIYVQEGTVISGDVVTVSGDIYINGTVNGDAVAVFGNIIVNGVVAGDAVTVTGKIDIGDTGKVGGNTVEALGGAFSGGKGFKNIIPRRDRMPWGSLPLDMFSFMRAVGLFIFASLIYLIMPKPIENMSSTIEQNIGKRIGLGVLLLFGSPLAMIIISVALVVTIIGIVVVPFAWLAYVVAGLIAMVPIYMYIGKKAMNLIGTKEPTNYLSMTVGIFGIWLLKYLIEFGGYYSGWVNSLISLFIFILGTGTLLDYLITNRKQKKNININSNAQYQGAGYNPNYAPNQGYSSNESHNNMGNENNEHYSSDDN